MDTKYYTNKFAKALVLIGSLIFGFALGYLVIQLLASSFSDLFSDYLYLFIILGLSIVMMGAGVMIEKKF